MEYLFIIGRTSKLCQAELKSVLQEENINYQLIFSSSEVFHLQTSSVMDVNYLIKTLGGTIKIAQVKESFAKDNLNEWLKKTFLILLEKQRISKEIVFGVSQYGDICFDDLNHRNRELKRILKEKGYNVRFVLPSSGRTLSSVVISKQKVDEISIVKEGNQCILAKTVAVSDFEDWGKRDFGRPCSDPHSGMLPLKVARMMVNLASQGYTLQKPIVLDPFCGVGTILGEGITLGYEVIGTDISEAAVQKSQKNLEWLENEYSVLSIKYKVFKEDATHVSEKISAASIDAIVTEPYLGPVIQMTNFQLPIFNLRNIILGLDKLYLGCLREWRKILKPGGTVVMAFPSFKINKKEFFVKKALDSCENLGYTLLIGPLPYSRPQAVVRRNIYLLKYGTH